MSKRSNIRYSNQGFTMVVIAALFIAFAVIAAVAVERNTTVQLITRRDATVEQLTRLSNAIIEYGVFNQTGSTLLYPCPAPDNVNTSSAAFGTSTVNCFTGGMAAGTTLLGGETIRGMVPVQTLSQYGIGINDAFDPWNNRIMYVVNRRLTLASTTSAGAQASNPTVTDNRTGYAIPPPDFILISYGRDGVGGIRRGNTTATIACTNGTATLRFENCDTDTVFVTSPTYTVSSATATTYYDDLITHYQQ